MGRRLDRNLNRDTEMTWRIWLFALVTNFATIAFPPTFLLALAPQDPGKQVDKWRTLDGEWTFFEDRTEGRSLEQLNPPMSTKFSLKVE